MGYSPWSHKELDMTEGLTLSLPLLFLGTSSTGQKARRVHICGVHSVPLERTLHSLVNMVLFFILTEISMVSSRAEFLLSNNFPLITILNNCFIIALTKFIYTKFGRLN